MEKIAVIPARSGSKRLQRKNYRSFNNRNLVQIAKEKCLASGAFDRVVISSDDPFFESFATEDRVEFLLRENQLAADNATTDMVVDYFFSQFPTSESILWVNSVSPLQTVDDIKNCSVRLNEPDVDCVMAVNTLYQHCCLENEPLNFDPNNAFEPTQDLKPIQRYIYSCMGWKRDTYVRQRNEGFKGLFPGKMSLVEASVFAGMLIKYEEDFLLFSEIEKSLSRHLEINKGA